MTPTTQDDHGRLLLDAAPVARRLAERCCDDDCRWYHGVRPYWRVLGLAMSPDEHAGFYAQALAPLAASGHYDNVLVSGTADHGMPAAIVHAWRAAGRVPGITVVDRCPTPLLLNRWYARRAGLALNNVRADILAYRTEVPYDLVCTHFFITWFPPKDREALFRCWAGLLRPGGKLVTVTRLRPAGVADQRPVALSDREREGFASRVRERMDALAGDLDLSPAQLVELAERYNRRRAVYTVRSDAELRAQLEGAGFEVEMSLLPPVFRPQHEWRGETNEQGIVDHLGIVASRSG